MFFVGGGERTLSLKYVLPVKVEGDAATHPVLDNLKSANLRVEANTKVCLNQFKGTEVLASQVRHVVSEVKT